MDLLIEKAGSPPKPARPQLLFDVTLCDGPAKKLGYEVFEPSVAINGLVNTDTMADRYGVSDVTIRNLKNQGIFPFTWGFLPGGLGTAFYDSAIKARAMFVDYLKFLRYSGAREHEASVLRWENINLETEFSCFPSEIQKKGGGWLHDPKFLKLNPDLLKLLQEMKAKRDPNSPWLFPSKDSKNAPDRENPEGKPQTRWDTQWDRINEESGLRKIAGQRIDAHHLRHRFISQCLMVGVPPLTVTKWVGDSLKMIQKVYGHLIAAYEASHATQLEGKL
jgi:integrase